MSVSDNCPSAGKQSIFTLRLVTVLIVIKLLLGILTATLVYKKIKKEDTSQTVVIFHGIEQAFYIGMCVMIFSVVLPFKSKKEFDQHEKLLLLALGGTLLTSTVTQIVQSHE